MTFKKRTKLVCTIGPASADVETLVKMIQAGMNVARLNFSHGQYKEHKKLISNIRKAEKITGVTITILQDLQGPKIRLANLPEEGYKLKKSQQIILSTSEDQNLEKKTPIIESGYKLLHKDIKKGDTVLIDDGLIELKALKVSKKHVYCRVIIPGVLHSHKGINLPNSKITTATITRKDKEDLNFGLKNKVDMVALSFVKDAKNIKDLRKLMGKKQIKVVAKIERHEAISNLKEIIEETDGVMVARGDLALDITPAQVPLAQKKMIKLSNAYGKPVITATQVMHSMIENPRPTRAEISDAANAVIDHTDAIMLSNESATGKFPVQTVKTLNDISSTIEEEMSKSNTLQEYSLHSSKFQNFNHLCLNACELALDTKADYIIVFTTDGYTAREVSKHRPFTQIITVTNNKQALRELNLSWGQNDIHYLNIKEDSKNKSTKIINYLKKNKIIGTKKLAVLIFNASKTESQITLEKL